LRYLSDKFLKRPIQQGSHDSLEDAKAALDLVKLKIKHGDGLTWHGLKWDVVVIFGEEWRALWSSG
jgi:hypothetical protein